MLIVEADADNRVRIYPYDVLTDNYFPYTWEIDKPSDPSTFRYTREARYNNATRPFFDKDAKVSVLNVSENSVEIEFSQAESDTDPYGKAVAVFY